jgi:hypoxanthine phosphoribosyltransferase
MRLPPHRMLADEASIARRVDELAGEIAAALPEGLDLVVVGVLTGGFVFTADLSRALVRHGKSPRVELAWASLYGPGNVAGERVQLIKDLPADIEGRAVLLVDDILDTGRTLALLRDRVAALRPAWLRTCLLLDKPGHRIEAITADFRGFYAPEGWIFGYGLDHDGDHRGLPFLAVLER